LPNGNLKWTYVRSFFGNGIIQQFVPLLQPFYNRLFAKFTVGKKPRKTRLQIMTILQDIQCKVLL